MADYLESYAARFELPVRTGARVEGLERDGEAYSVLAGSHRYDADNVVVAAGVMPHEQPVVPAFAAELDPAIVQLHSADYRTPEQLREGPVLVVGASHSGGDISYEVACAGFRTMLSGPDRGEFPIVPESRAYRILFPLGRFLATRVLSLSTPIGRKIRGSARSHGAPLIRVRRAELEAAGIERVVEKTVAAADGKPVLDDGRVLDVANVIWCTGFRYEHSWIRFPVPLDADGFPDQRRGAAPSLPGLYFTGMLFLHSFASMLVLGAAIDGKRVADHIVRRSLGTRGVGAPVAGEAAA
jgi:putative flavoprotein involved in K+ transport